MSVVRENLDVLNPAGSNTNLSRTTEVNFFGFRETDKDINEVNTGIGDTIYTAASSSTFPNPLSQPDKHPTFGGTFTGVGTITYKVEISDHTSSPNKFIWYKNGVLQASGAETDITSGTAQNLDNGVKITFNSSSLQPIMKMKCGITYVHVIRKKKKSMAPKSRKSLKPQRDPAPEEDLG